MCLFEWGFSLKRGFTGLGNFHRITCCQPTHIPFYLQRGIRETNEQTKVTAVRQFVSAVDGDLPKQFVPDRPVHYQEVTDISRSLVVKSALI